jgi:hypothetical protein
MKKLLLPVLLLILATACKKNKGEEETPKQALLSEVSTDGAVNTRFVYTDGLLSKIENYDKGSLNAYITIAYENKKISVLTTFTAPGDIAQSKVVVETNDAGKVTVSKAYNLQGQISILPLSTTTWKYNGEGQVSNIQSKDASNKLLNYVNLSYFPGGGLKETNTFIEKNGQLQPTGRIRYSIPNSFPMKCVEQIGVVLGADYVAKLISDGIEQVEFDQNGVITYQLNFVMSSREYNTDGTLKKQVVTKKPVKPAGSETAVSKGYGYELQ